MKAKMTYEYLTSLRALQAEAQAVRDKARAVYDEACVAASAAHAAVRSAERAHREQAERNQRNATERARREAKSLADKYGFVIDPENFGDVREPNWHWWVMPPEGIYAEDGADDPFEGCRCCGSWDEALDIARTYAAAVQAKRAA